MIKRAVVAVVACLALAAAAAGCGGGGGTTSAGESSQTRVSAPTKAVFIKEADGICQRAVEELNFEIESYSKKHGIPLNKEPTRAQQEELYEGTVLPSISRQGEEIGALTPPAGDEETISEIVEELAEEVAKAEADPGQLVEGKHLFAKANSKARAYGMKVCGSNEG